METTSHPRVRALAIVSGVVGLLAGLALIGFFTLESSGGPVAGFSIGHLNDLLGAVQYATLAPVAWALASLLPATRPVRIATVVAVAAMATFAVLSLLLVLGVLTFAQQIGPVIVTIVAIYGWLLLVSLVGHRTRTLPRRVTRIGLLLGAGLLVGLVLAAAGFLLPGIGGRVAQWVGYGLAGAGWLGLPVWVLLLARHVFGSSPASAQPAGADLTQGALRS